MPEPETGRPGRSLVLGIFALLGFAAFFLSPALRTDYISDDVVSSLMPGMARYSGESAVARTLSHVRSSMLEGRFYPLAWLQYDLVFFAIRSVFAYKALIIAAALLDLLLYVMLIRRISGDHGLAILAGTITIVSFQFRAFFDPILAFHGLLQLVVAGILLSLLALQRYLEDRGRAWLRVSAGLFLACNLAYEVCYPLVLLYVPMILYARGDWRSRLQIVQPFVVAVATCVGMSLLMRWLHPSPSYIHGVNGDPRAFLAAMAKQTSAGLPLSYFLADPAGLFADVQGLGHLLRWLAQPDVALAGGLAAILSLAGFPRIARHVEPESERGGAVLLALGLMLAILPAVMIAISSKYQAQVGYGKGYLPVYIQYFGVGLILARGLRFVSSRVCRHGGCRIAGRWLLMMPIVAVACLSYRANVESAIALGAPPGTPHFNQEAAWNDGVWSDQRRNLEAALDAGVLDAVPERSVVLLENEYPGWHDAPFSLFFYAMHAGKVMASIPPSARTPSSPKFAAFAPFLSRIPVDGRRVYWLRDVATGKSSGYVVVAALENDPRNGDPPRANEMYLFVRRPGPTRVLLEATVRAGPAGSAAEGRDVLLEREARQVRSGRGWVIETFRSVSGQFDPRTVTLRGWTRDEGRLALRRKNGPAR